MFPSEQEVPGDRAAQESPRPAEDGCFLGNRMDWARRGWKRDPRPGGGGVCSELACVDSSALEVWARARD